MKRFERWAPLLFFAILAALELAHGITRLDAVRSARTREIVETAAEAQRELSAEIRAKSVEGRRHAAYVARLQDAAMLAKAAEHPARKPDGTDDVSGASEARDRLTRQILAQLASFPEIDRVRVLSDEGREIFRCERMGGGAAAIPQSMLLAQPDEASRALAAPLPPGGVALSELFLDRDRVEVPESERYVIHYVAKPAAPDFPGFVVLTVYASPMLEKVRRFAPIAGVASVLIAGDGSYLAAPDRAREMSGGSPSSLRLDHPEAAAVFQGATRVESGGGFFLAAATGDPPWIIVTEVPASALASATHEVSRESTRVVAAMVATLLLILCGAIVFHRLALRAVRLRQAEEALRQLEQKRELERRLEVAERLSSLGLLTAGVAHEINNPLEGIANYLSLLEREDVAPDKRRRHLDAIRHGFERIRDVVQRLLGFARPVRTPGSADLRRVVARALELARFSKDCREVTFETKGADDPSMVTGDEGALEQVLLNLFLNAGRAMKGTGRIAVEIERSGSTATVVVDDAGPGIPPEHVDRIVGPFFTTGEGSGLGLSVSYGIARAHGGTLAAENRPGGGARFTLRLPVAATEGASR